MLHKSPPPPPPFCVPSFCPPVQEQYGNNRAKHRPTVVRVDGLRLAFLTRWTLSSSMLYNHHVATRFQTWREVCVRVRALACGWVGGCAIVCACFGAPVCVGVCMRACFNA